MIELDPELREHPKLSPRASGWSARADTAMMVDAKRLNLRTVGSTEAGGWCPLPGVARAAQGGSPAWTIEVVMALAATPISGSTHSRIRRRGLQAESWHQEEPCRSFMPDAQDWTYIKTR